MSSEVCPFCGKSFKRLKSHLPHCKAAKTSQTTPPRHQDPASSSSLPPPPPDKPHAAKTATSATKTKTKLSEKIRTAAESSSAASAPSSAAIKGKKKSPTSRQTEAKERNLERKLKPVATKSAIEKRNVNSSQTAKRATALNMELNDSLTKDANADEANANDANSAAKTSPTGEDEKGLSGNDAWTSKGKPKVTLHDVRASLGRSKQNGRQRTTRFVDRLPAEEWSVAVSLRREPPSQLMVLTPRKDPPLDGEGFLDKLSAAGLKECSFSGRAELLKDGLRMDGHSMGRVALASPAATFLQAEVSSRAFGKDLLPLKPHLPKEEPEMARRRDTLDGGQRVAKEALSQRRLGQVTLRELPDWLVSRWPRRPQDALELVHKGWQWYYRRYIDVKRGGVGGVAMLLAGYCVLSYVWAFPHLKHERWRRHH